MRGRSENIFLRATRCIHILGPQEHVVPLGTKPTKENILHLGNTTVLELAEFKTSKSVGV
jgi:hypothetical protein